MAALTGYKSDLSNMLSVARKIPEDIIDAIGPAPGVGRRGWIELADLLAERGLEDTVRKAVLDPAIQRLESDERFKKGLGSLKPAPDQSNTLIWTATNGTNLAKVTQSEERVLLTIDRRKSPAFADFVLNRVRDLYVEFEASLQGRS
jgi:ParB family transcriptional regulator, chromosome partitioning protein